MAHENTTKQYYRLNSSGWYMTQKGNKFESLSAYKRNARIELETGNCHDYETHAGCIFEAITEQSYNRLRRWVLNQIMK